MMICRRTFSRICSIDEKYGDVLLATVLFCCAIVGYAVFVLVPWREDTAVLLPGSAGTVAVGADSGESPAFRDDFAVDLGTITRRGVASAPADGRPATPQMNSPIGSVPAQPSQTPQPQQAAAREAPDRTISEGPVASDKDERAEGGAPISALSMSEPDLGTEKSPEPPISALAE